MELKIFFEKLMEKKIPFVLIGGTALITYGSSRATFDTDIAIKLFDVDRIINLIFELKGKIVIDVDKNENPIYENSLNKMRNFIEKNNWGFIKVFFCELEIDILYDVPVPFMTLYNQAIDLTFENSKSIKVASLKHLKIMKEKSINNRDSDEKSDIDKIDLNFINKKIKENGGEI
ncbi:MAG TPA: hypothetical protein PKY81_11875 [bacterium]|nr:hypothetical protein [bacterium]